MKKLNLSGFDLGIIIAFAVLTVLGAGGWWYLSGALQSAQDDVHSADADFNKYSVNSNVIVSPSNGKTLKSNTDLLKTQLAPLIQTKLMPKDGKLQNINGEDPVAWKHELDDEVNRLKTAAKAHNVDLPPNFYFSFSRYQNNNPLDNQTQVLSKQLLAVDLLSTMLFEAPVKNIQAIRRTYEEDPHTNANSNSNSQADPDRVNDFAAPGPGNNYIAYPYEIDFVTTPESFRLVIDKLLQSPNIFVLRSVAVTNSRTDSPLVAELDKIAQTPSSSMTNTSPGEVAATTSTVGPQYLFGNEMITVKVRIDMIEWLTKPAQ